jgi:hypothetical protein
MGGMSEFSAMTKHIDWRISYGLFSLVMIVLGWIIWWWLMKVLDHLQNRSS